MSIKNIIYISLVLLSVSQLSCKKDFLDKRPNSKQVKFSAADCQALLDDYNTMNSFYPCDGEISSDDYYLSSTSYSALADQTDKDLYRWVAAAQRLSSGSRWSIPYSIVYNANLVIHTLEKDPGNLSAESVNLLKGAALFFRANVFYQVAQVYAKPFNSVTADQDPGIPVRTSADLEVESGRGTLRQTYDQIISDLNAAVNLLPVSSSIKSRPNKVAAFAALARTYLGMEDYTNAGIYADSCLKRYSTLLDYNTISKTSTTPFVRFNDEVLFHTFLDIGSPLATTRALIDPDLYNSYQTNDLRKTIFFKPVTGGFRFTGNYNQVTNPAFFSGLATDEIYLIRAECYARNEKIAEAMADLNTLMKKRWSNMVVYPTITAASRDEALIKILTERRKELLFRGIRWTDLRRLNKDLRFQKTLTRTLTALPNTLPPNDLRYVLLIPQPAIDNSSLKQNPR